MRVAITGGAGSGKSTVLAMVREIGVDVVSADDLARQAFAFPDVKEWLAVVFGGDEDRRVVLRAILEDHALRRRLNEFTHHRVWSAIRDSNAPVVETPLLLEACLQRHFDRVWLVACDPSTQRERLLARLGDERLVGRLMSVQLPLNVKRLFADEIVRTDQPLSSVFSDVKSLVAGTFC